MRDEMFDHMQDLPIRYFDTHTHGDIMSYYTNDIDTLRQMISQSIPQMLISAVTIVGRVLHHAVLQRVADAGGAGCGVLVMLVVTSKIGGAVRPLLRAAAAGPWPRSRALSRR